MVQLRAASNNLTPLEHKRFQTTLREIAGSNQTVMPAANNDRVVFHPCYPRLNILQHLQRRITTGRAHDPTARVRGRAAHVQIFYRRSILRPTRRGSQKEKLFERQFALENISFRQTKLALEIERRHHLSIANQLANVWS